MRQHQSFQGISQLVRTVAGRDEHPTVASCRDAAPEESFGATRGETGTTRLNLNQEQRQNVSGARRISMNSTFNMRGSFLNFDSSMLFDNDTILFANKKVATLSEGESEYGHSFGGEARCSIMVRS